MTKMKREYNVLSTDDVMNHYAETAKKANNWKELPVQKAVMLVVAFKENFAMQLIN